MAVNLETVIGHAKDAIRTNSFRLSLAPPAAAVGLRFLFDIVPQMAGTSNLPIFEGLDTAAVTGLELNQITVGISNLVKNHTRLVAALEARFQNPPNLNVK